MKRLLAAHYGNRAKKSNNHVDTLKYEVFEDDLLNPYERLVPFLNGMDQIDTFHDTFLSNFYAVPISYGGRNYSSIEHAYQGAKFHSAQLRELDASRLDQLNEIIRNKGVSFEVEDVSQIFANGFITAGMVKRLSTKLKAWGLERHDWDDIRVDIMIELQIIKFRNHAMAAKLLRTDGKYLVEGNDWNDTFWGVCGGRGKNILGRILMKIRSRLALGMSLG